MANVYSTQFIAGSATSSRAVLSYTVPAGFRAVVRTITISNNGSGITAPQVLIEGLAYIFYVQQLAAGLSDYWEGNHVVNAGQTIQAASYDGPCLFLVSGFLLSEQIN